MTIGGIGRHTIRANSGKLARKEMTHRARFPSGRGPSTISGFAARGQAFPAHAVLRKSLPYLAFCPDGQPRSRCIGAEFRDIKTIAFTQPVILREHPSCHPEA